LNQPTLWYFADPMCSWCWGFSPVITRIKETFGDQINISLNMGGLRPGTTEPMTHALRDEILHHWHDVHRLTGQPFRFENAMPEGFIYDTEPPSRAALSFAKLQPENTLAYFSAIQSAFYTEGLDVTQEKILTELTQQYSVDTQAFQTLFASNELRALTGEHFKRSRQAGVQGFPTLIWQQEEVIETLSRGYLSWETISKIISQQLSKLE
jgi:putative protein-disulfide isomerase